MLCCLRIAGGGVITDYRLYRLRADNSIASATDLSAPDDASAIAAADRMCHFGVIEIWQDNRRVARVGPSKAAATG